ncbi:oxidoreductase [Gordonibacter sp. 28C]|uniref:4Fe-4S dicluster domain-containing protein n=1 Tax=Gordonibacter sp. 28C TaxID=2078569 RepID=UPI000DF84C67|nr:4Fe-4S dicluster domain-containing protein [Gordonibacter sp. 28C]RDB63401.1 oxidoreductase [Gordonibacter sp. 28C]
MGLLIDYEYCTGCYACIVACQRELELDPKTYGIKVHGYGPVEVGDDKWEWSYLPMPTSRCDLCAERTAEGRLPSCVHHCPANVMYYGTLEELSKKLAEKSTQVLYSL